MIAQAVVEEKPRPATQHKMLNKAMEDREKGVGSAEVSEAKEESEGKASVSKEVGEEENKKEEEKSELSDEEFLESALNDMK